MIEDYLTKLVKTLKRYFINTKMILRLCFQRDRNVSRFALTNESPYFIDANVVKNLTRKNTYLFNAILRLDYFPSKWRCAEVVTIPKLYKLEHLLASYRPISLLPIFSKLFEKLLLKRLLPILENNNIIPAHQFGFRQNHGTTEQCHLIIDVITDALENKRYCSTAFLEVQRAFGRVWQ